MVQIINNEIFNGIAGARPTENPKYYIMHNDAGSMSATSYINWLQSRYDNGQSELGFAHYYIDRNSIVRVENTYSGTWSAANYDANMNSLSYEVCQQFGTSDSEFIENENMVLMQMAEDMTYYGDTPNYGNIKFHNEFSSTSCPARSLDLHGGDNDSLRDYVIGKIKYYQSLGSTVDEMLSAESSNVEGWQKNSTGWWYRNSDGSYPKSEWKKIGNEWFYFDEGGYCLINRWFKEGTDWYYLNARGAMVTGWFLVGTQWFYFNESGRMVTGWVKYKEHWYYLNTSNGFMESNQFIKHGDGWYYLKDDGSMADKPEFTVEPNGLVTIK